MGVWAGMTSRQSAHWLSLREQSGQRASKRPRGLRDRGAEHDSQGEVLPVVSRAVSACAFSMALRQSPQYRALMKQTGGVAESRAVRQTAQRSEAASLAYEQAEQFQSWRVEGGGGLGMGWGMGMGCGTGGGTLTVPCLCLMRTCGWVAPMASSQLLQSVKLVHSEQVYHTSSRWVHSVQGGPGVGAGVGVAAGGGRCLIRMCGWEAPVLSSQASHQISVAHVPPSEHTYHGLPAPIACMQNVQVRSVAVEGGGGGPGMGTGMGMGNAGREGTMSRGEWGCGIRRIKS